MKTILADKFDAEMDLTEEEIESLNREFLLRVFPDVRNRNDFSVMQDIQDEILERAGIAEKEGRESMAQYLFDCITQIRIAGDRFYNTPVA